MKPRTIETPNGLRTVTDELCTCGHLKRNHTDTYLPGHLPGHGKCRKRGCKCKQFRWVDFVFESGG